MSTSSTYGAEPVFPSAVMRFALALALVIAAPEVSYAQETTVTTRLSVFTGGQFGGTAQVNLSGGALDWGDRWNLEATPFGGVRYEVAFLRYLAFGGELVASFWRPEGADRRNPMLDLAMTPRVRYPIVLSPRFMVEPYLVVPFGFSLAIWNGSAELGPLDRANPGMVIGTLAGATFLTRSHVGAMLELGWMHHVAYDQTDTRTRGTLLLNQFALRAGVVYAF